MSPAGSVRRLVGKAVRAHRWKRLYHRFRNYTMVPRSIYGDNLELANSWRWLPGCVVECGVWRGGMSAGLACVMGRHRRYFLFDSFQGLPPAKPIDGMAAIRFQQERTSPWYHHNCAAPPQFARNAMRLAGATSWELVEGWFEDTVPGFTLPERIALLRLDADWYDSTMACLEHLFDRVAPGGLILLDDYYAWDGCSRALHDFLSRRSATERIRSVGDTCYLVRREAEQDRHDERESDN
jgi:O-methyltransferase